MASSRDPSAHMPNEGFHDGKTSTCLQAFGKGFQSLPPMPKHSSTWEVAKVTVFFRELGDNHKLSLKMPSQKLAVILTLVLAHKLSGLARLTRSSQQEVYA